MRCPAANRLLLLLFLLGLGPRSQAQYMHLSLYKANGTIAEKYLLGDYMQIKKSTGIWVSGELEQLFTDTLIVAGVKLAVSDVHAVRVTRRWLLGTGLKLGTAGILWPGIVAINGLSANLRPLLPRSALISSTSLLVAGALLSGLAIRTYSTQEPDRLRIIDFNFNLPPNHPTHDSLQQNR